MPDWALGTLHPHGHAATDGQAWLLTKEPASVSEFGLADNIETALYRAGVTALRIFAAAGCSKRPDPMLFLD